jgi:CheY-like chemotaxis protein
MIDDNEVPRSAASKLLRTQGVRVLEADCGVWACNQSTLNLKFKTCDGLLAFAGPLEIRLLQGKVI